MTGVVSLESVSFPLKKHDEYLNLLPDQENKKPIKTYREDVRNGIDKEHSIIATELVKEEHDDNSGILVLHRNICCG